MQSIDLVLLVMNANGMEKMLRSKVSFGAEASIEDGPVGRDARAATDAGGTVKAPAVTDAFMAALRRSK